MVEAKGDKMRVVGKYYFNDPQRHIEKEYATELAEIYEIVGKVNAQDHHDKVSEEKTMPGKLLYSPSSLNKAFKKEFFDKGWINKRVKCDYPTDYYLGDYLPVATAKNAFRDMDFVKNDLGVEVQFGKYSFMVYNVSAKMTIFNRLGIIRMGVKHKVT